MKMTDEIFHQVKSQQTDLSAINQKKENKGQLFILSVSTIYNNSFISKILHTLASFI